MGQAYAAKVSDRYLYRIEAMVIGAHDLEVAHKDLKSLFCRFPDSLLREWISDAYLKKLSETAIQLKSLNTPLEKENNLVIFKICVTIFFQQLPITGSEKASKIKATKKIYFKDFIS